ncbi:MarR family winged helix-turn-helix transcriptional regulator [Sulfobacillus thermosulfidooxidans]|uniref:MarR family winged helix-turn-helix transcriptional regulator n=1 Tax=Sulfobacillus thermosulfidooxidans TaxID=28034 RepID=UPI0006B4C80E|nr:MarR family transcriptional regulator [Sulfobacillus thermosulfidooxidans]
MEDDVKAALRAFFDAVLTAEPLLNELRTEYGLSLAQIRCLFQLRSGEQTAGELAKSLGIRATSLTRMIERLETENWVKRQNDKHDRRRIVLTLTREAEDMLSHLDFFLDSPAAIGIKRMNPEERVEFTRALQRFLQHVSDTQNLQRD